MLTDAVAGTSEAGHLVNPVFKRRGVPLMIFLNIFTLGIYTWVWFLRRQKAFNNLQSRHKLTTLSLAVLIILYFSSLFTGAASGIAEESSSVTTAAILYGISTLTGLAWNIAIIAFSFRVRRILLDHFGRPGEEGISISGVGTFFFTILYLQYKLNRLPSPYLSE